MIVLANKKWMQKELRFTMYRVKYKKDEQGRPIYKPTKGLLSRWPKGVSGNLKGRVKGSRNKFSIAALARAIKFVEQEEKEQFMVNWIKAAWGKPDAMNAVVNYMLPRLKSIEGINTNFEASMDDDLARNIQKELCKRYEE